jgi:hypothetical protein
MKIHTISWNLFAKDKDIITLTKLNKLTALLEPNMDIIVLSFQEISNINHIKTELSNYKPLKNYNINFIDTASSTFYSSNYNVGIFVLISNKIVEHIKIVKKISKCITRQGSEGKLSKFVCTKGIVGIKLVDTRDEKTYLFMGCHLPVFNVKHTSSALKVINKIIEKHADSDTNIVIAGDFNSRLPVDNNTTNELYKHYRTRKIRLNKKEYKVLNSKKIKKMKRKNSAKILREIINEENNKHKTPKYVVNMDTLESHFSTLISKHLKEPIIKFPPTYKFNYKNGNFLKKNATLTKFPGYADRIFYNKLKPVRNSYQTIHVVGSDHMPVTMTFN